ncbi:cache domain-containing protein [Spirochaeta africana]|uniref:Family 3 adenylate cyclase n=1 Tax=Spirochaeta africana (strain ATCC 700263 / DSM 8902 / Z-7692) TaxID=889378 RepID=H9UHN4_SPIAZ|nr:adenylate/guanylate cyclase domain-containing protein [Spirochaeta africana]AFG37027.1 family 3 adenylate cyclase [Spirochaeta africana DSM 8902]
MYRPDGTKVFFRTAFNVLVISVIAFTGLVIGGFYFYTTISLVERLSTDLFDEISRRPQELAERHLEGAKAAASLNLGLAEAGLLDIGDYDGLADHFVQILRAFPDITIAAWGDEQGSSVLAYRTYTGDLEVHAWHQRLMDGVPATEFTVHAAAGPSGGVQSDEPLFHELTTGTRRFDPRQRPWYRGAVEQGGPHWTEPYVWSPQDVPGITYGVPMYADSGELEGVFTIDFELEFLSLFMQELSVKESGKVFILDSAGRIIAHPNPVRTVDRQATSSSVAHALHSRDPAVAGAYQLLRDYTREHGGEAGRRYSMYVPEKLQTVFDMDGERQVLVTRPLPISDSMVWYITLVIPEDELLGDVRRSVRMTVIVCIFILLLSLIAGLLVSSSIKRPLRAMFAEVEAMGSLDLMPKRAIRSYIREIDQIGDAIERTKSSLRSFEKYIPAEIVRQLQEQGEEARLGGEHRELTILFCDLEDFSGIASRYSPQDLVGLLEVYFREISQVIRESGGTVDKFIGDAVMGFWGAPVESALHAATAARAAMQIQDRLQVLRDDGYPFHARIGLCSGEVMVGNIGAHDRMNYTVIGQSVNIANRLESLNKIYGTGVLVSESTRVQFDDDLLVRRVDTVRVNGVGERVAVYQPMGDRHRLDSDETEVVLQGIRIYEQALQAYEDGDMPEAVAQFLSCLRVMPGDPAARYFLARLDAHES